MASPTDSRTIRVFLSSTFRDFAEERDLLVRKVFPELRRKCRERQVELVDVDLRWGITEKEAQQGKVLPICLAEIDRSRPWFMGFIGERYGWVPQKEQYDLSLILEQPWLEEHRGGKSVTELEILHGVLNNPKMAGRAFFYFRDSKWSKKKGGAYLSEGSEEKSKLEVLKNRIRRSGFPVLENYPSPEALAERVKEDLWKLIDETYPASEVPDALAQERMRHEAFVSSRLGLYIGGQKYCEALDALISSEPRKPILVCGASGGGKSALLANWIQKFSSKHPEAIVLTHFLGTGADAAHPVNMAIRLLCEISRIIGEELVLEGDPRKALWMLETWLEKAGAFAHEKGGIFVLVLDAVDKMTDHRDLEWWPRRLPEGVALVASCLDSGLCDVLMPKMEWTEVRVSPLDRPDCETFIQEHLAKYRKSLTPEQTAEVLGHPLSGNPLFLRTLLEELRVFGVHEELNHRIAHYLASGSMDDLFVMVLERVESDNTPDSVRAALEVLWAAKESFAEDALLTVSELPPALWAPIGIALDESLIGAGGGLAFSHDYLRKAVEDRYLRNAEDKGRIGRKMAEFCAKAMAGGRKETSRYVRRHAVGHFLEAEDWDNATAALCDLEYIEARATAQELPALLVDYAEAVRSLPESEQERQTEAARQAELDRYAREMVDYAAAWSSIRGGSGEAEPRLPRPVESVPLWTSEQIAAEEKRLIQKPNRLDLVKAFRLFVANNTAPLQDFSTYYGFVANHANNDAPAGPVAEEGKRRLEAITCIKLLKQFGAEESYSPVSTCMAILEGHVNDVTCAALVPDSRRLVSGSADSTLRIWDLESGECLRMLRGHRRGVICLALSLDGRTLVSGGTDGTLRVWDINSGECLRILEGHREREGWVTSVALTPDGRQVVSGSWDCTLRVWELDSGECLQVLSGHTDSVHSVALSADGRQVVSGSVDKTLRLWDLNSGECLRVLHGHTDSVHSVAVAPDGRQVVSGSRDRTLRVWNLDSGECLKVLHEHPIVVESVVLSVDGRLLVCGGEGRLVRILDLERREYVRTLVGHKMAVLCLALSIDFRWLISGSEDHMLRVWDLKKNEFQGELHLWKKRLPWPLVTSRDGSRLVTLGHDDNLEIWNVQDQACLQVLKGHTDAIQSAVLSADGHKIVSGGYDGTVRVWDLDSGECLQTLSHNSEKIQSVALSLDGLRVVSGSTDCKLRFWNLENAECLWVCESDGGFIERLALSPDGHHAVSGGSDGTLRVWSLDSGKCLQVLEGHARSVNSVVFSSDGRRIVSGGSDDLLLVWDTATGECLRVFGDHLGQVHSISISEDGNWVVSGGWDNTIRIWGMESDECLAVFRIDGLLCCWIHWATANLTFMTSDDKLLTATIKNLTLGPLATTALREILSEDLAAVHLTASPPCCGQVIYIPGAITERIEHWVLNGGEGGFSDPSLLLDCPSCGNPLRINPFFYLKAGK